MKESSHDKQWAKAYLLDPLTAPEPSQETGIASSHNLSAQLQKLSVVRPNPSQKQRSADKEQKHSQNHNRNTSYPTPPSSTSPSRSQFHSSNPFATPNDVRHSRFSENISPSRSSPGPSDLRQSPNNIPVTRATSVRVPPHPHKRPGPVHHRSFSAGCDLKRNTSLSRRYPGDMSHRPLDILKKEARAADRSPHLRRKNIPGTDTIDALDTIGGTYHHGGPYDATLASRNRNKKYSPVAAVEETNMEAIRATPREYLNDSLQKHKPLQGTATIPSGGEDFSGNPIRYEEGADLMREPDAAGGPYKRWDDIQYHPDDLKGKGEPSYTYEKDLKEKKHSRHGAGEYELQSGTNGSKRPPMGHNRSYSEVPRSSSNARDGFSNDDELRRNNSTGRRRIGDGLRRRFGSLRRKKSSEVQ